MIPFSITKICIKEEDNTSYIKQHFDAMEPNKLNHYLVDEVTHFILDYISIDKIQCADDIEIFFYNFSKQYNTHNSCWSAMIYKNNKWENANPSIQSIFENVKKENELKDETIIIEDLHKDKDTIEIVKKMREYFEDLFKKDASMNHLLLDTFNNISEFEQLAYLFHKSSLISLDKYEKNKKLFYDFANLSIKYLEKYIKHIKENEEHKELLQQANEVYNNINKLKLCFGF
jgi:hypothetical protein